MPHVNVHIRPQLVDFYWIDYSWELLWPRDIRFGEMKLAANDDQMHSGTVLL